MRHLLLCFLALSFFTQAQDPNRFTDEIVQIQKKYDTLWNSSKETVVFTGSSSVRYWSDLQERFPKHQIVNTGFGGSLASDLLVHVNKLILQYKPKKVFIYEGDNDIDSGKKSKKIISDITAIITKIKKQYPSTDIILIAAKPSIQRWHLRRRYKQFNRKLKKLTDKDTMLQYANVWTPMLKKGKPLQDIFIEDDLHMNAKGYAIWFETIKPFLD